MRIIVFFLLSTVLTLEAQSEDVSFRKVETAEGLGVYIAAWQGEQDPSLVPVKSMWQPGSWGYDRVLKAFNLDDANLDTINVVVIKNERHTHEFGRNDTRMHYLYTADQTAHCSFKIEQVLRTGGSRKSRSSIHITFMGCVSLVQF